VRRPRSRGWTVCNTSPSIRRFWCSIHRKGGSAGIQRKNIIAPSSAMGRCNRRSPLLKRDIWSGRCIFTLRRGLKGIIGRERVSIFLVEQIEVELGDLNKLNEYLFLFLCLRNGNAKTRELGLDLCDCE
jgi:hypothetical protein